MALAIPAVEPLSDDDLAELNQLYETFVTNRVRAEGYLAQIAIIEQAHAAANTAADEARERWRAFLHRKYNQQTS